MKEMKYILLPWLPWNFEPGQAGQAGQAGPLNGESKTLAWPRESRANLQEMGHGPWVKFQASGDVLDLRTSPWAMGWAS